MWANKDFLQERNEQYVSLMLVNRGFVIRHWRIHKNRSTDVYSDLRRRVLFLETRPEEIKQFFEQNESPVRKNLPPALPLVGDARSLESLHNPSYLIFDSQEEKELTSSSRINIEGNTIEIINSTKIDFKDVFGSRVSFQFGVQADDVRLPIVMPAGQWPSVKDALQRAPSAALFLSRLQAVHIHVNGKKVARLYSAPADLAKGKFASSEAGVRERRYNFQFPEVELSRALFLEAFKSPG
jgi:hypothetical protein